MYMKQMLTGAVLLSRGEPLGQLSGQQAVAPNRIVRREGRRPVVILLEPRPPRRPL